MNQKVLERVIYVKSPLRVCGTKSKESEGKPKSGKLFFSYFSETHKVLMNKVFEMPTVLVKY